MVDPLSRLPFASGRDADVYALDDNLVLRRYRAGGDVAREAEFMRYAGQHDYPVPVVHAADGPDLVLQRLDGPTMLAAVAGGHLSVAAVGTVLADLHERLHQIPAPSGAPDLTLVHGDLHPDNVIITPTGPMVIDWRNATEGPAEFDVAMTAVIIAQAALNPADPDVARIAQAGLTHFLASAPPHLGMLDRAIAKRAQDPNMTEAELTGLGAVADLIRVESQPNRSARS